ncbi:nucleotidyltransferase domain-containing protein [Bacillus sp. REN3]|uniref:nucleotidyltransferase domain-containing protein n=1 Tax=Bacillus sp. REN3 TaxID=2802440 RepID=UPI001AEEE6AB|nr:nucleotidyltransferase domain-containing protein [Bacillus sp. REN3]
MNARIIETLKNIEEEYRVKILYACESGSRAWGFPSKDSDYDVRFIYVYRKRDYLSIDPIGIGSKRDVIELPIDELLDVSGWELTKTLRLFRKSNPPLLEWMRSSIVYYQVFSTIERMQKLSRDAFAPHSCIHHYLNMAAGNYREFLQGEEVKIKKYFYVLRPVLAAVWIQKHNEFPPLEFPVLLEELIPRGQLKEQITTLLNRKLAGDELDVEPQIHVINEFLEKEMRCLREGGKSRGHQQPDLTPNLDTLFRETLEEVWPNH